jgi:acyl-CoA reductase-like NAD-dependent aldehyde dehydrogenase
MSGCTECIISANCPLAALSCRTVQLKCVHTVASYMCYVRSYYTTQGYVARMRYEPIGVVAAVVPWNYPLLMAT